MGRSRHFMRGRTIRVVQHPVFESLERRTLLTAITEFSAGLTSGSNPNAIVAGPDGNLWFTENGTDSAIGRVNLADWVDLSVTLTAPAKVVADSAVGNLTFVTTVTNAGPADATGVTVEGLLASLPVGVVLVTATPSAGTFDAGTGAWTVGTLAAGARATLTTTLTVSTAVSAGTQVMQTATVSADQVDADPSNDTATAVVATIPQAPAALLVTINQAAGQDDPTRASVIHFTAVFSETVADFAKSTVTLGGTSAGATVLLATDSGNHKTFDIAVTGMSQSGTVTANIPAGKAHDAAGNANMASTSTDNSVEFKAASVSVTEFSAGIPAGRSIRQIIQGPDGNLWFTFGKGSGQNTNGGIGRITPQGVVSDVYVDRESDYPTVYPPQLPDAWLPNDNWVDQGA